MNCFNHYQCFPNNARRWAEESLKSFSFMNLLTIASVFQIMKLSSFPSVIYSRYHQRKTKHQDAPYSSYKFNIRFSKTRPRDDKPHVLCLSMPSKTMKISHFFRLFLFLNYMRIQAHPQTRNNGCNWAIFYFALNTDPPARRHFRCVTRFCAFHALVRQLAPCHPQNNFDEWGEKVQSDVSVQRYGLVVAGQWIKSPFSGACDFLSSSSSSVALSGWVPAHPPVWMSVCVSNSPGLSICLRCACHRTVSISHPERPVAAERRRDSVYCSSAVPYLHLRVFLSPLVPPAFGVLHNLHDRYRLRRTLCSRSISQNREWVGIESRTALPRGSGS